jgi:hypothetical protein
MVPAGLPVCAGHTSVPPTLAPFLTGRNKRYGGARDPWAGPSAGRLRLGSCIFLFLSKILPVPGR